MKRELIFTRYLLNGKYSSLSHNRALVGSQENGSVKRFGSVKHTKKFNSSSRGTKKKALLNHRLCYVMALLCDRLLYLQINEQNERYFDILQGFLHLKVVQFRLV